VNPAFRFYLGLLFGLARHETVPLILRAFVRHEAVPLLLRALSRHELFRRS
jgi:hypothetical protein